MSKLSKNDIKGDVVVAEGIHPTVRLKPHIGIMLHDAYSVIADQFRTWKDQVAEGVQLERSERTAFVRFADAFVKLAKEEREQEKRHDPATLSDTELVDLVEQARRVLSAD